MSTVAAESQYADVIANAEIRKHRLTEKDTSLRDRGHVECNGTKVYFAIDADDVYVVYETIDPANPSVTRPVMTTIA
jgi:hypothetical protein